MLESYSRVLESLAASILNRVDDVMYADSIAVKEAAAEAGNESKDELSPGTLTSSTLLDLMSWSIEQGGEAKNFNYFDEKSIEQGNKKIVTKFSPENKRISYLEKLEHWGGLRSPTARH